MSKYTTHIFISYIYITYITYRYNRLQNLFKDSIFQNQKTKYIYIIIYKNICIYVYIYIFS